MCVIPNVQDIMNKQEETWEKLDSEFDHHLVDMKPYVLKLPHKTGRPVKMSCITKKQVFYKL